MSSYVIRHLPPGLIVEAKARAREAGTSLDAYLIKAIAELVDGTDKASYARQGGAARAAALTPEARKKIAQAGAEARWRGPSAGDDDRGNR